MRDTRVRAIRSCGELQDRAAAAPSALSLITSTAVPPLPEDDDRAEGRIVGHAGDQFARLRPHDHGMDGDAGDARVGLGRRARAPRMSAAASRTASSLVEIEPHAADVRFVHDIRRQDFDSDRPPSARSAAWPRRPPHPAFARQDGGRDRDRIGRKQPRDLDRIEPGAALARARSRRSPRAAATSGAKSVRQARRRRHQVSLASR